MNPQQPNDPVLPPQNSYDFITNPASPPRRPIMSGGSFMRKILIVVGGAVLFMILATMAVSLLGGGSNEALKSLAAEQQELIRVAEIGSTQSPDSGVRSFAVTSKLSTQSHNQELVRYLEGAGAAPSEGESAAMKDESVDAELNVAASSSRFDEKFLEIFNRKLSTYVNNLQNAYNDSNDDASKQILKDSYNSALNLIGTPPSAE